MDRYPFLRDKSLLITGGTGSFGRALSKELLLHSRCRRVIIFSRDEWKQWEMSESPAFAKASSMRYFLGDVRDLHRLKRALNDVDYVVHAAALKQVPAAEYNPTEFVQTNILGAVNLVSACIEAGVRSVVALSTDKAVNPLNLYGATKLCADKVVIGGNVYVGRNRSTLFSVVRYGNVLGSRGSVIVHWKKLLEQGCQRLPMTDMRMTRFSIEIEQAVIFVLEALERTIGGELFIPKIPSVRIVDMAQALAPGVELEIIGIRPGEKLHEMMFGSEEGRHALDLGDRYLIVPELRLKDAHYMGRLQQLYPSSHWVAEGFAYVSNENDRWLDVEGMKEQLVRAGHLS